MAKTLNGRITLQATFNYVNALDLANVTDALAQVFAFTFASGVGADQANALWHDRRTVAPGVTDLLDLAGGIVDAFGTTLTLTRVKALLVKAAAANESDLQVAQTGSGGAPLFLVPGGGVNLPPGAAVALVVPDANGISVTAGVADLITVSNPGSPGSPAVYDIIVAGTV
jgi:hypothetical protein